MDPKLIKKNYSKLGWLYVAGTLLTNGILYGVIFAVKKFFPSVTENTDLYTIVQMIPRFFICYPIFAAIIFLMPKMQIPQKKMGGGKVAAAFCMTYSAALICNVVALGLIVIFSILKKLLFKGAVFQGMGSGLEVADLLTGLNPVFSLIFIVILAPVAEELLFRKFLIDRIYGYGEAMAILLSGLMFGLYHGNLQQFIYATTIGSCFAYIYTRTGRIRYTIILHMLINSMGSLVLGGAIRLAGLQEYMQIAMRAVQSGNFGEILGYVEDNIEGFAILGILEFVIGCLILTGIILWIVYLAKKKFHLVHYIGEVPKGKRFSTAVLNPGILVFIIIYAGLIIFRLITG
ncbi:MAG: CPBP family intramembrane metalloprotease [Lachnospiraceae bacterium]|nr:CPBP family intramembrane metalloprotease [Lachnospiraceae bacterium]